MLTNIDPSAVPEPPFSYAATKRKRRPAGTPDPDAEVVSLSPKTLLESDRYVCEICNQGFQRDQNLQMHRRRHKVPWKLLKRETPLARKRVFVCPEPSCLHHDPCHALGDLVGIKKHFRRKHSNQKQWVCDKCSKGYAVQSDYKAHLKTCGTRGHSCDCGRVFSRVESFIEHQDACSMGRLRSDAHPLQQQQPPACLSRTALSPSPSSDTNLSAPWQAALALPKPNESLFLTSMGEAVRPPNLELQLLTKSSGEEQSTQLQLSIGSSEINGEAEMVSRCSPRGSSNAGGRPAAAAARVNEQAQEQLRVAMAEKAYAEEARQVAKRQIEAAEQEFANAKRIRQAAQAELEKAQALKESATKKINAAMLEITCHSCKSKFQQALLAESSRENSNSIGLNFISSALRGWEVKKADK
ncbi:zinc finger protein SHOOT GRAVITROPISM 5-like [Salvia splendens]|uniref:zinc finger protein SHOOT GRAVITROPISM 5-like n=1 Tax=Salvia splendens TaxID=180675 RepID=UPI001C25BAA4|nr:zinc finger protein SHOOT GRAVITROPISM 5-like [Salvia splendens]